MNKRTDAFAGFLLQPRVKFKQKQPEEDADAVAKSEQSRR
jgi:hypothetical protein